MVFFKTEREQYFLEIGMKQEQIQQELVAIDSPRSSVGIKSLIIGRKDLQ